jgi:hypothetical protein
MRGQLRAAFGGRKSLLDVGVQVPGGLLFPPVGLGGQGLEPVPLARSPAGTTGHRHVGELGISMLRRSTCALVAVGLMPQVHEFYGSGG